MLKLDFSRQASNFLEDLPAKQFKQVMGAVLALLKNPYPEDSEKLSGYDYRRKDIGEYRVIYRVDGETLKVPVVGKRNDDDVYKILKRKC
jgi:mRNA interferase RelE/StbE